MSVNECIYKVTEDVSGMHTPRRGTVALGYAGDQFWYSFSAIDVNFFIRMIFLVSVAFLV